MAVFLRFLTGGFRLVAVFILLVTAPRSGGAADGCLPPGMRFEDSKGTNWTLDDLRGECGTVFVFLSTECPISRAYLPALADLHSAADTSGLRLVGVESNVDHDAAEVAAHVAEFAIPFPVLLDPRQELADALTAETCPEALLVDATGAVRYRGRVDDRFVRRGGAALEPAHRDLAAAIEALVAGTLPERIETDVLGCPIHRADAPDVTPQRGLPTGERIMAILAERCGECHRDGGIGPMDLTDPATVRTWADDIAAFTADRSMPPWKPLPGWGHFENERRMPDDEIEAIAAWVKGGGPPSLTASDGAAAAREGDEVDGPRWRMGEPDLVLEPEADYTLGADGADEYRCYVLPTGFGVDRYVTAFEILPGNSRVVHHVIAFVDARGTARALDAGEPTLGYTTQGGWPGFLPAGGMGGWAPGNVPAPLPPGVVRVLPAGADIVLQVHYHRSGKPERDRTRIGLHFAKEPPRRAVRMIPVSLTGGPFSGLRIPAGAARHTARAEITVPEDVQALAITPHMHLLGREIMLEAVRPDDSRERLIHIDRWDFNWQETYRYVEPVFLPAGTRLHLETTWDNSADNPFNPSKPPRDVRWGEQTTDEMGIAFLEVTPIREEADPTEVRVPTPTEQLGFFLATQADNRREGRVPWKFEIVLKLIEARLAAANGGLVPSLDSLPLP